MAMTITYLRKSSTSFGDVSFSDGMDGTWGKDHDGNYFITSMPRGKRSVTIRSAKRIQLLEDGLDNLPASQDNRPLLSARLEQLLSR